MNPEIERAQAERVHALRASRNAANWRTALTAIGDAARNGGNLVGPIVTAVEACATVGEISDTLREVFGEFHETATA